jgi:hypothetical protein
MANSNTPTESELLTESNEIYEQKKQTAHHMNVIATETAKMQKVQKSLLNRLKDYYLYQNNGWVANDPLQLDKAALTYDKVSPIFIRLMQVIEDLRAVECLNFLDPYIQALDSKGVKVYINPGKMLVSDKEDVLNAINSMGAFQKQINALDKEIKEVKSLEAEDINLTTKSEFAKLVAFYNKKENKGIEAVEDQYQDLVTDFTLRETGYTKIFDESLT